MAGYSIKDREIIKHNIFKLDTAIVRLLEKRLAYASELGDDIMLPLMREELLNLVIDENKEKISSIMMMINDISFEED